MIVTDPRRNRPLILFALILAIGLSSSCTFPRREQRSEAVRIGVLVAQTGPFAELGIEILRGVEIAIVDVQEQRPAESHLDVLIEDGGGSEPTALARTAKMISGGQIAAVVFGSDPGQCGAVSDLAWSRGIVVLAADEIMCNPVDPQNPRVIGIGSGDVAIAQAIAARATGSYSRVAVAYDASPWGANGARLVETEILSKGKAAVAVQEIPTRSSNVIDRKGVTEGLASYEREAQLVLQARPELVVVWSLGSNAARFVTRLRRLGYAGDVIGGRGVAMKAFPILAKEMADGVVFVDTLDAGRSRSHRFVDTYQRRYNEPVLADWAARGYDAVLVLVEALRRAESENVALATAFKDIRDYDGVSGASRSRIGFGWQGRGPASDEIVFKSWTKEILGGSL